MGKLTSRSLWNITAALLFFIAVFLPGTIALAGVGDGYPGPEMDEAGATPTLEPLPGQEPADEGSPPAAGSPLAVAAPAIQVWYGDVQEFGATGHPQRWVNILGNAAGATSATYKLNDGPLLPLRLGPDARRLLRPGDFNIEIDREDLDPGPNTVTITAANGSGEDVEVVTFNYTANSIWPLPYEIDWSTGDNLQNAVKVVDGKWRIENDDSGVRTVEIGYDRILALGDVQWTSYEITVPITFHGLDPAAWDSQISYGPGFGIVLRWQGHTQDPLIEDESCNPGSPANCGWRPEDGSAWYAFWDTKPSELNLNTSGGSVKSTDLQINEGDTYSFKLKVNKRTAGGSDYALKVWPYGQSEPANYTLQRSTNSDPWGSGSILLVAHHVDATFGNLSVVPIGAVPSYTLTVNTTGEGQVDRFPANPTNTYPQGTQVTLTATPATGWAFLGWGGALSGSTNPVQVVMNGNKTVTATFVQLPPAQYTLTVDTVGEGTVGISPDKPTYAAGEQVTLTATPATGWSFVGWSGDLSSSTNPLTFTVQADTVIRANFTSQSGGSHTLTVVTTGRGSVMIAPYQEQYTTGETVELTARPDDGWEFDGWSGDISGTGRTVSLVITRDMQVTAHFSRYKLALPLLTLHK